MSETTDAITAAGRLLTTVCYQAAVNAGWHTDPATGQLRTPADNESLCTHYLMLAITELAEAVEGNRCNKMGFHIA